jgi:hypothetical protein
MLTLVMVACGISVHEPGEVASLAYEMAVDPLTDDVWLLHSEPVEEGESPDPSQLTHVAGHDLDATPLGELSITTWPVLGFGAEGPLLAWTHTHGAQLKARIALYDRDSLSRAAERSVTVGTMDLAPSGAWLSVPAGEGTDLLDASLAERVDLGELERVTWLPDDRLLSISDEMLVQVWEAGTLSELTSIQLDTTGLDESGFGSLDVHPEGHQIILGVRSGDQRSLRVVDLDTGQVHAVPEMPAGVYSGDGSVFVYNAVSELLTLDTSTLQVSSQPIAELGSEWGVWVSEDGAWVLLQDADDQLSLVDTRDGSHRGHTWNVGQFVVRDGQIWSVFDGQLGSLDLASGELDRLDLGTPLWSLAHQPQQDRLVVRSEDGQELLAVDPDTGALVDSVGL